MSNKRGRKYDKELSMFVDNIDLTGRQINSNKQSIMMSEKYRTSLINNATKAELIFKSFLDRKEINMYYEFQKIIYIHKKCSIEKFYIADFYFKKYNLIIEIDGEYHDSSEQKDKD